MVINAKPTINIINVVRVTFGISHSGGDKLQSTKPCETHVHAGSQAALRISGAIHARKHAEWHSVATLTGASGMILSGLSPVLNRLRRI